LHQHNLLPKYKIRKIDHAYLVAHRRDTVVKQNFICKYCFGPVSQKSATVDHKKAVHNGGLDNKENLVVACYDCNHLKGHLTIDEFAFKIRHSSEIDFLLFRFKRELWLRTNRACHNIKRSSKVYSVLPKMVIL
jgi:hypothetical protein